MALSSFTVTASTFGDRPAADGLVTRLNAALADKLENNVVSVQFLIRDRSGIDEFGVVVGIEDSGGGVLSEPFQATMICGRTLGEVQQRVDAFIVDNPATFVAPPIIKTLGAGHIDPFCALVFFCGDDTGGYLNWQFDAGKSGGVSANIPGGSGSQLQYRLDPTTFAGLSGSSVEADHVVLTEQDLRIRKANSAIDLIASDAAGDSQLLLGADGSQQAELRYDGGDVELQLRTGGSLRLRISLDPGHTQIWSNQETTGPATGSLVIGNTGGSQVGIGRGDVRADGLVYRKGECLEVALLGVDTQLTRKQATIFEMTAPGVTLTLWPTPLQGDVAIFRNAGGGADGVVAGGSNLIEGGASVPVADGDSLRLYFNGTVWRSY